MAEPVAVSDATFDKTVLQAKGLVLVDFWAPWCGPCRAVAPVVDELAKEYDGKVAFAKVNVDDCRQTATRYGVRSIPTLLLFDKGKPMQQVVGARGKGELKKLLDESLTPRK